MPYIKKVEGRALSRLPPTVQPISVARKPKRRADPDLRRKPPAPTPQADIHAPPVASITRGFGRNLTMASAYISRTVLSLSFDMKSATTHTFSGLQSFAVDLYSSSYSDDSRITLRDTNSGDKLEIEGLTNAVLRGAVLSYVHQLGYRKEDASARTFLEELSGSVARALEKEEA